MFSVENRSRADQRARQRAFFECGYTSFAMSGTGPQLMENEHGTTTAKGNRRARGSWLTTGGCLREGTGLVALPGVEGGQMR